ncbi:MAG: ATP-dependent helicase [Candidatus Omnitrophica bacterium]|nr:ATP-dependent helicase [Candidatus Omnitrophota bacterium]
MKRTIDYERELNASQWLAVRETEGPCLVIAGAGSGKTRVLVYRVAYLVEQGVAPEAILLLTFTRKSAREMLERAAVLLDSRCQRVGGGTFHSFAHMLLRRYAAAAGLSPHFTIMDQADAEAVVNHLRGELPLGSEERHFPKKRALLHVISKSVNTSSPVSRVVYEEYPHFFSYAEEIQAIAERYAAYKRQKGLLDFDDLLVCLRDLLQRDAGVRAQISRKYRYLMVDEYQDTNRLQAEILIQLLDTHQNIMAVGDDAQSIYSFRGAHFRNIMDFPKLFSGARVVTLEENYRSVQPILSLTNELISQAAEKFDKQLFSSRESAVMPLYVETQDEHSQSRYVCRRIRELQYSGVPLGDIAVLFRAGWHSNSLEIELSKSGVPFVKYGGLKFVDAAHVKDMLSYVRLSRNPADTVSWNRVLTMLPGVGAKTAQRMIEAIVQTGGVPDSAAVKKIPELQRLLNLIFAADMETRSPADVVRLFAKYYQPFFRERYDDYHKRTGDLDALEQIAVQYDNLDDFLADMSLEPPEPAGVQEARENQDKAKLVLSTIHSAKGLEWHTVFIIFLADGHIPAHQSLDKAESLEEERRLLYVAMTRAKEQLFLIKPMLDYSPRTMSSRQGSALTEPSRFLHDIRKLHRFVNTDSDVL